MKLQFDFAYNKYLKEKYPELYQKGIEEAVKNCGCYPKSIAASWYAVGYIKGCLQALHLSNGINEKNIH